MKTPKPFLRLDGEAILAKTIAVFDGHRRLSLVQPVLPRAQLAPFDRRIMRKYDWKKCRPPVTGGRERQDSVFNGLRAIPLEAEFIIIHDAARPFVSASLISRVLEAARRYGAALAAIPVQDTVKKASPIGLVRETLDRRNLWLAQTPQAFRAPLLREAHSWARGQNLRGSDDASLVEAMGHPVRLVPGSPLNLKVTTREDLALARSLIGRSAPGKKGGQ